MTYLAVYSLEKHEVELEKKIKDGAKVKDDVRIAHGDEHLADLLLVDYDRERYQGECRCRGGDWAVYEGKTAFSWDAVTPKTEEEATE